MGWAWKIVNFSGYSERGRVSPDRRLCWWLENILQELGIEEEDDDDEDDDEEEEFQMETVDNHNIQILKKYFQFLLCLI